MAFTGPLVLKANFRMGPTIAGSIDVSDQITHVRFVGEAAIVEIPPTGTTIPSARKGSEKWSAEVNYMSNDAGATTDLTRMLFDAIRGVSPSDNSGVLLLSGTMRAGAASSVNPRWACSIIVSGLGLGGDQETLAVDSQTYRVLGAPSYTYS